MSGASSIEWTDATWNPVRGCSRVSEGCRNCYAERIAARFSDEGGVREVYSNNAFVRVFDDALPFAGFAEKTDSGPRWTGLVKLIPHMLDWPLSKRKPLRIFVNSMSDLFHEKLSNEAIAAVFGVMAACPQHTFQILTKRPERMREWFTWHEAVAKRNSVANCYPMEDLPWVNCMLVRVAAMKLVARPVDMGKWWPLPNVWLGTSVEDQATADERIPHLLATPAAKRFVSYEPALGPVDFWAARYANPNGGLTGAVTHWPGGLDWMIVGGESGPGARPFDVSWARSIVEECRAAGVAVFVKQLGARPLGLGTDLRLQRVSSHPDAQADTFPLDLIDRKGGDWNEWPEDLRVREFPR